MDLAVFAEHASGRLLTVLMLILAIHMGIMNLLENQSYEVIPKGTPTSTWNGSTLYLYVNKTSLPLITAAEARERAERIRSQSTRTTILGGAGIVLYVLLRLTQPRYRKRLKQKVARLRPD